MRLDEHLPADHRLNRVYRYGAGLCGVILLVFGVLGLLRDIPFFSTTGKHVAGMSTNGALSTISIVVAALLIFGAFVGGNFASTLNIAVGGLFVIGGLVNLALMSTSGSNFLAFRLPNVFFSFAMGLLIMTFGMYGRVGLYLPYDNPYWQKRHPGQAAWEPAAAERRLVVDTTSDLPRSGQRTGLPTGRR
jgi:hypothetical protein